MSILIRLSYTSNSQSKPEHLRHDFLKIVNETNLYGNESPIYGALYDLNGSVFHYLEGQKSHVDQLYKQLLQKTHQYHITLLGYEQIDSISLDQLSTEHHIISDSTVESLQHNQKIDAITTKKTSSPLSLPLLTHMVEQHKIFEEIRHILKEPFSPSLRCINSFFVFSTLFFALLLSYFLSTLNKLINQSFSAKKPELAAIN